jgi:hypothetical protein
MLHGVAPMESLPSDLRGDGLWREMIDRTPRSLNQIDSQGKAVPIQLVLLDSWGLGWLHEQPPMKGDLLEPSRVSLLAG